MKKLRHCVGAFANERSVRAAARADAHRLSELVIAFRVRDNLLSLRCLSNPLHARNPEEVRERHVAGGQWGLHRLGG